MTKIQLKRILLYVMTYMTTFIILILLANMLMNAFSRQGIFTFNNFRFLFESMKLNNQTLQPIKHYMINTVVFSVLVMILETTISLMAAYTFSRCRFKLRKKMLNGLFFLYAFPALSLLVPIFFVLNAMNLLNTLVGVILVKAAIGIPMSTYLLKGFFDDIPWDIEWSSWIDGCSRFKTIYTVLLPCIRPGVISVATLSFLYAWGEFMLMNAFIYSQSKYPLSLYITTAMGDPATGGADLPVAMAVGIIYILPVLVYFWFTQFSKWNKGTNRASKGI